MLTVFAVTMPGNALELRACLESYREHAGEAFTWLLTTGS
jgi:hypothetical protein